MAWLFTPNGWVLIVGGVVTLTLVVLANNQVSRVLGAFAAFSLGNMFQIWVRHIAGQP